MAVVDASAKETLLQGLDEFLAGHEQDPRHKFDADVFRGLYRQFLDEHAHIDWNNWKHLSEEVQRDYDALPEGTREVLSRVVVIKLNGGLGTTMGCAGPKSLIKVKENFTFLDLAIRHIQAFNQVHSSKVPLILMNSFNTDEAVAEYLRDTNQVDAVETFMQSRCPRLFEETLLPVDESEQMWYPPGHGNVFASLAFTGLLDRLLTEGRDICFLSNVDNTGAGVDQKIAQFMADSDADYIMEVTPKTEADIKGGTLIEIDGHIMHLEMPQVPPDHLNDFCSTKTFKIFNTNNIWVNLRAVKRQLATMKMEIIVNKKKLPDGRPIVQLETSLGGAIRNFAHSYSVSVPRRRFLPVKKNDDLLAISSDLYSLEEDYTLRLQARHQPVIQLSKQFQSVDEFRARFAAIPRMRELRRLIVSGNVFFEDDITLKGSVEIRTSDEDASKVVIERGSVLEDYDFNRLQ